MTPEKNIPDYFFNQSAVVPYRIIEGNIEILLITSRNQKRWVIPKGIIEPGMDSGESAVKEAFEEAGIEGNLSHSNIGVYEYDKWGGTCRVEVFAMKVEKLSEKWQEDYFRLRKWFPAGEAAETVKEKKLKKIILGFFSRK